MSALRGALLWASTNPVLAGRLPKLAFVRRAARRFMPGEDAEDALREAARLGEDGIASTLTLLGENVDDPESAQEVVDHYVDVLDTLEGSSLDVELSVKPTQLGLDVGEEVAAEKLETIVALAERRSLGTVWIDMEASPYVDATLRLFRKSRERHQNVGVCLQAYLRRTEADLDDLLPLAPAIRVVKGAYRESPDVAFPRKRDVDERYVALSRTLLDARAEGRVGRPVIATHDVRIQREVAQIADDAGLDPGAWEFAMLYGIGTSEQRRLASEGRSLRVLISYGSHWFPWYMRRLAERPANILFVLRKMVGL